MFGGLNYLNFICRPNNLNNTIMEKEQIEEIIEKYKRKSSQERRYGPDKCDFYEQVADFIEDNIDEYLDDSYETEDEILFNVKEVFLESDDFYSDED